MLLKKIYGKLKFLKIYYLFLYLKFILNFGKIKDKIIKLLTMNENNFHCFLSKIIQKSSYLERKGNQIKIIDISKYNEY